MISMMKGDVMWVGAWLAWRASCHIDLECEWIMVSMVKEIVMQ